MTPSRSPDDDLYGSNLGTSLASGSFFSSFRQCTLLYLDRTTLYPKTRWLSFFFLLVLFSLRIYVCQGISPCMALTMDSYLIGHILLLSGFYIVTYALAIYLLNLFLGFLTPQSDPETDGYVLPVRYDAFFVSNVLLLGVPDVDSVYSNITLCYDLQRSRRISSFSASYRRV